MGRRTLGCRNEMDIACDVHLISTNYSGIRPDQSGPRCQLLQDIFSAVRSGVGRDQRFLPFGLCSVRLHAVHENRKSSPHPKGYTGLVPITRWSMFYYSSHLACVRWICFSWIARRRTLGRLNGLDIAGDVQPIQTKYSGIRARQVGLRDASYFKIYFLLYDLARRPRPAASCQKHFARMKEIAGDFFHPGSHRCDYTLSMKIERARRTRRATPD
jgi:hypothetical protein